MLVPRPTQIFEVNLKLAFSGQGNGAGGATFQANLAAGKAAQRMRHDRLARVRVPCKDVVRAEVKALQVGTTGVTVDRGKPWKFPAQEAQQGHFSILQSSHE
jgi:hypothetical protein